MVEGGVPKSRFRKVMAKTRARAPDTDACIAVCCRLVAWASMSALPPRLFPSPYAPATLHADDARYAQVPMRLALFSSFRFASSALYRRVRYLGGRLCLCGVASSRMLWAVPFFCRKSRKRCRRVAVVLLPPFRRLRTGCRSRQRFRFRLSAARSGSPSVIRSLLSHLYMSHHVSHPVRPLVPSSYLVSICHPYMYVYRTANPRPAPRSVASSLLLYSSFV